MLVCTVIIVTGTQLSNRAGLDSPHPDLHPTQKSVPLQIDAHQFKIRIIRNTISNPNLVLRL